MAAHVKKSSVERPITGLLKLWRACPKWHAAFSVVPFLFFTPFPRPASVYCEEYVYIYAYLTAYRMYKNYHCYHIKLPLKHFYTNQGQCEVLTRDLSLGRRHGGDWANT
jgi:hypothetical protein